MSDGGSPRYFEKGSHWMEVGQGRVSVAQLDGGDAQRPDVAASVVSRVQLLLTCDDLPERRIGETTGEERTRRSGFRGQCMLAKMVTLAISSKTS